MYYAPDALIVAGGILSWLWLWFRSGLLATTLERARADKLAATGRFTRVRGELLSCPLCQAAHAAWILTALDALLTGGVGVLGAADAGPAGLALVAPAAFGIVPWWRFGNYSPPIEEPEMSTSNVQAAEVVQTVLRELAAAAMNNLKEVLGENAPTALIVTAINPTEMPLRSQTACVQADGSTPSISAVLNSAMRKLADEAAAKPATGPGQEA